MPEEPESTVEETPPEPEEAEEGVQVTVERQSPCACVIRVEADADYLRERYQDELSSLQEEVKLPGFRRGKAPIGLVERRMGGSLRDDLVASVLGDAYDDAVSEHDLNVVAEPEMPDLEEVDWEPGQPLEFEFRCEVMPEVELEEDQYKDLEIELPRMEADDELIEGEMQRFASRFATWEEVTEAGIDWDDYVEAEVSLVDDDWSETIGFYPRAEEVGPFGVEGVKGALIGAKAGDEVELDAVVDADEVVEYDGLEPMAGQNVRLKLKIDSVMRHNVPELDDELAQKIGLESVEEVRDMVVDRLEDALNEQREELEEEMLRRKLVEAVEVPLPDSLVQRASERQQGRQFVRLLRSGVPRDEAERRAAEEADRTREAVEFSLRSSFLLRKIAEKERILVTESEVDSQVRAFAGRQGWREEKAREYLEERGMLRTMRNDMRESKTLEFLKENAEIKEMAPEEFSEKYGEGDTAAAEQTSGEQE
ncbi:MAG: trigger factor [Candidatus Brocadiia bacterium]